MDKKKVIIEALKNAHIDMYGVLKMTTQARNILVELLTEEEAVVPTLVHVGRDKYYNDYVCPRCSDDVVYGQNYCPECGVQFLWEGLAKQMPDKEKIINEAFDEDRMDMLEMAIQKDLERFHSIPEQTGTDDLIIDIYATMFEYMKELRKQIET